MNTVERLDFFHQRAHVETTMAEYGLCWIVEDSVLQLRVAYIAGGRIIEDSIPRKLVRTIQKMI